MKSLGDKQGFLMAEHFASATEALKRAESPRIQDQIFLRDAMPGQIPFHCLYFVVALVPSVT